jgi:hypothetical protein
VLQSAVRISHSHLNSRCPLNRKAHLAKVKGWLS